MLASRSVHLEAMVMHWTKNERQRILLKEEQECVLLPWNMGRVAYLGARNRKIACVGMVARIGLETIQEEHRGITKKFRGTGKHSLTGSSAMAGSARRTVETDFMYTINTPRVEECIGAVMARHNGTSEKALGKYFEEVHQHLAPLARDLERENVLLRNALEHIAGSCEGRAAEIARAALMGPNMLVEGAAHTLSRRSLRAPGSAARVTEKGN